MNIFKKFGSFASNSWKDFSEYYDQQQLEEENPDDKVLKENSFELRKRSEGEVVAKKAAHGFFRRHFSKKKLQMMQDPRSPTTEFERTPIQTLESDDSVILSPFNLKDMLASVDSAVFTPVKTEDNILPQSEAVDDNILNDSDFIGNVGDWNDFKFNDKLMTESLIVELSTLDINVGDVSQSTIAENESEARTETIAPTTNASDDMKQCLLAEEAEEESSPSCKIVGCIVKSDEQQKKSEPTPQVDSQATTNNEEPLVMTSTPKKSMTVSKLDEVKKVPRTPLLAISNSPMMNKTNLAANSQKKKQNMDKLRRKKPATACSRQLPKAPSTPLTPLFKNANKCVSHFDKENF